MGIAIGDTKAKDTESGFFTTMDDNVEIFAQKIKADPQLASGFNCVGFSQGNSLCRGYIQKYNDPPVVTFLSVHGTVSGVAGFPNCNPQGLLGPVCRLLAKSLGDLAFSSLVQNSLFQADYFRDPFRTDAKSYKAEKDTMVYPNEGEHWGHFADNSLKEVLTMRDTDWYKNDMFGLRAADEAGKILFNSTSGNHLQFSLDELAWWVTNYFLEATPSVVV